MIWRQAAERDSTEVYTQKKKGPLLSSSCHWPWEEVAWLSGAATKQRKCWLHWCDSLARQAIVRPSLCHAEAEHEIICTRTYTYAAVMQ